MSIFDKHFDVSSKGIIKLDPEFFKILDGIIDRISISDTLKFENITIPEPFITDYTVMKDQKMSNEDILIALIKRGYKVIDVIIAIKFVDKIAEFKKGGDRVPYKLDDIALSLATIIYFCLITGKTTLEREDHVPSFLKRSPFELSYEKFHEYSSNITTSKLALVIPYIIKSINLNRCD